jgi:hypothetical protein
VKMWARGPCASKAAKRPSFSTGSFRDLIRSSDRPSDSDNESL